ncbi:MAG: TlpA disulfide reductase family protein [Fimbriimonadaceae bacterium]
MTFALIFAFATGAQAQPDSALSAIRAMMTALERVESVELQIAGEVNLVGKLEPYTATVKATGTPMRYWAKLEGTEQIDTEYASFSGATVSYTGDAGKREVREVPTYRALLNHASAPAVQLWQLFFDRDRYRNATEENTFYVFAEEVEGRTCDLVGLVSTEVRNDETFAGVTHIWIDRETHLPLATHRVSFARGRAGAAPKIVIRATSINPAWDDSAFDVPEQAPVRTMKRPEVEQDVLGNMKPGDACPDLDVQQQDMQTVKLKSLIKGRTLVSFWAPWCGPCIGEMKALSELPEVKSGALRVVAVGCFDSKQNIRAFAEREKYPFMFAIDPDCEAATSVLTKTMGVSAIPHAYLFGADGRLIDHWIGFQDGEELAKKVRGK